MLMALIRRANNKDNLVETHGEISAFGDADRIDRLSFNHGNSLTGTDSFTVIVSEDKGSTASQVAQVTAAAAALDDQPKWRLVTASGFAGEIGGRTGEVFGTNGFEDITVALVVGTIQFDASFNRGGDVIRLDGNASDWRVELASSSAVFSVGNTFIVVPIGTEGMAVVFDDGLRALRYDEAANKAQIGTQEITELPEVITTAASPGAVPDNVDPDAAAQLLMAAGGWVMAGGNLVIYGTAGTETVRILHGQIELDPSFNRGGDGIFVDAWTGDFTASLVGSNVLLDGPQIDLLFPVGTTGTSLNFRNGERIFGFNDARDAVYVALPQIGIAVPLENFV